MPSYRALNTFLAGRFADRLVLTFGQVEDLLGFALPPEARVNIAWWAAGSPRSEQADAWLNAERSAVANLAAQTVVFERTHG